MTDISFPSKDGSNQRKEKSESDRKLQRATPEKGDEGDICRNGTYARGEKENDTRLTGR
jgi:hypothetical protein